MSRGNEKKTQIVKNLMKEINYYNNFSLFEQSEAIDAYSLEKIRFTAKQEKMKIIFVKNRLLKVALAEKSFCNDNFDKLLKNNNFIVLCTDPIKSSTLSNRIDKKLKTKIKIKAVVIRDSVVHEQDKIQSLIEANSEKELKAKMIQTFKNSYKKLIKIFKLRKPF